MELLTRAFEEQVLAYKFSNESVDSNVGDVVSTLEAREELESIKKFRGFDPKISAAGIRDLLNRVEAGVYSSASNQVKREIKYWAIRLLTQNRETVCEGEALLASSRQDFSKNELALLEALIAFQAGDPKSAISSLGDIDDPDTREVTFWMLAESEGNARALEWFEAENGAQGRDFFTPFGWCVWSVYAVESGKWAEVLSLLVDLESWWDEMPRLPTVEGILNAAMLVPTEFRASVLEGMPLYIGMVPLEGAEAEQHHNRAKACFQHCESVFRGTPFTKWKRQLSHWGHWLGLMNPVRELTLLAHEKVREEMQEGEDAADLIIFAFIFNIKFDSAPLRKYLEQRRSVRELSDKELNAECLLTFMESPPKEFLEYVKQHEIRLEQVMPREALAAIRVQSSLQVDPSGKEAKAWVSDRADSIEEPTGSILRFAIDQAGDREDLDRLREDYQKTQSVVHLRTLTRHLEAEGLYEELLPYVLEEFDKSRSAENASRVVACMRARPGLDHSSTIEFFEENSDLVLRSARLKWEKAVVLYEAGRYREAQQINDELLQSGGISESAQLDLNLCLALGDWERLGQILNSAWAARDSQDPNFLMSVAAAAGRELQSPDRALKLAKHLATRCSQDANILARAFQLHLELGRDEDADSSWIGKALELSSEERGPVMQMPLQEIATSWLPGRLRFFRGIEDRWRRGELPNVVAAEALGIPLARLFFHWPQIGSDRSEKSRFRLPTFDGTRKPTDLKKSWTVGLDITSIMVLSYVGLLPQCLTAFRHVKLVGEVMEYLFQERSQARFHQPSRIVAAKQLLDLKIKGQILVADPSDSVSRSDEEEFGQELACLLESAKQRSGIAICRLPILRLDESGERAVNLENYSDVVVSLRDYYNLLRQNGELDLGQFNRALSGLGVIAQDSVADEPSRISGAPVYVDRSALSCIQDANLLQVAATFNQALTIHRDVWEEAVQLASEEQVGESLVDCIERIRLDLQSSIESGHASFLPRVSGNEDLHWVQKLAWLFSSGDECDAFCVDDSYLNRQERVIGKSGDSTPTACSLDVLRHLESRDLITFEEYCEARYKLRRGGYAFVPVESKELSYWLRQATIEDDQVRETPELAIIRRAVADVSLLDRVSLREFWVFAASSSVESLLAIGHLWKESGLAEEILQALSAWVWRNTATAILPGRAVSSDENFTELLQDLASLLISSLFLIVGSVPDDRRGAYFEWVERSVLERLMSANSDLVKAGFLKLGNTISESEIAKDEGGFAIAGAILGGLSDSFLTRLIRQDIKFAKKFDFDNLQVLSFGEDTSVLGSEICEVAAQVLTTGEARTVLDSAEQKRVVALDTETGQIVLRQKSGEDICKPIHELSLLSPIASNRLDALNRIMRRLGPTANGIWELRDAIESRIPSFREMESVFEELGNNFEVSRIRLLEKIRHGGDISVGDLIPRSMTYWEKFVGPIPCSEHPEDFLSDTLVAYRNTLLERDLQRGLEICCLGALRDDLSPGLWLSSVGHDSVWNALEAISVRSSPFGLLGALDVALYRLDDERFKNFANDAVQQLCEEQKDASSKEDGYKYFQSLASLILNRMSLLDGGSITPGYWKRMCAYMQAGLVTCAAPIPAEEFIVKFSRWSLKNQSIHGEYSGLSDGRSDPMWILNRVTKPFIRSEVLGRMEVLKIRHEAEGRDFPMWDRVEAIINQRETNGERPLMYFPGPLEGHKTPVETLPDGVRLSPLIETGTNSQKMWCLMISSQIAALRPEEAQLARDVARDVLDNLEAFEIDDVFSCLESESVVAAATRDVSLANLVADALVKFVARLPSEHYRFIFRVLLAAAAAHVNHADWRGWLGDKLAKVVEGLVQSDEGDPTAFLAHLEAIEWITPVESWFHIPAKSELLANASSSDRQFSHRQG